jgi:hypothetical protein
MCYFACGWKPETYRDHGIHRENLALAAHLEPIRHACGSGESCAVRP